MKTKNTGPAAYMFYKFLVILLFFIFSNVALSAPVPADNSTLPGDNSDNRPSTITVVSGCGMAFTALPAAFFGLVTVRQLLGDKPTPASKAGVAFAVAAFLYGIFQILPCACSICDFYEKDCPGC